jgi:hypothetical protein
MNKSAVKTNVVKKSPQFEGFTHSQTLTIVKGELKRKGRANYHQPDEIRDNNEYNEDEGDDYINYEVERLTIDIAGNLVGIAPCGERSFVCHVEEIPTLTKWLNEVYEEYRKVNAKPVKKAARKKVKK